MKNSIKFLLSILSLSLFVGVVSAESIDSYISPLTTQYTPKMKQCRSDKSVFQISKHINRNTYNYLWPRSGGTINAEFTSKLEEALNKAPYYYGMRDCNTGVEVPAIDYLTRFKKIKGKSQSVIREHNGTPSGSSFYSNTLGANVFVVDAKDVINGVGEGQEYILRIGQGGEKKLMVIATKMNEKKAFLDDEFTTPNVTKTGFVFTKYMGFYQPDVQAAKIGNSYYIAAKN